MGTLTTLVDYVNNGGGYIIMSNTTTRLKWVEMYMSQSKLNRGHYDTKYMAINNKVDTINWFCSR